MRPLVPGDADVPEGARSGRFRLGHIERIIAALAGAVTIIAMGIGLLVWLLPDAPESCSKEGASLSNITVEERVAFREYLERTNAPTEGYSARQLKMPVNLISYDLHVDGFKRQHLTSKWSVYDAKTNSAVRDVSLRNRLALDVEPTACETNLHPAIWTPIVRRNGTFYFRLLVYDQNGNPLAERQSASLSGQP